MNNNNRKIKRAAKPVWLWQPFSLWPIKKTGAMNAPVSLFNEGQVGNRV